MFFYSIHLEVWEDEEPVMEDGGWKMEQEDEGRAMTDVKWC